MTLPLWGSFESVFQPQHNVDVAESTGHVDRWRQDLQLMRTFGITTLRYPVRWHRVQPEPDRWDWAHTDEVMAWMREQGMNPILDLVHHMSVPLWLRGGFADPEFADALLKYYEQVALRYPWVTGYTLFNEPFTTLFLAGSEGVFPPYLRGTPGFTQLAREILPAVAEGSRMLHDLLPAAQHVNVDTCERHVAGAPEAEAYTAYANDRRFAVTDILMGRYLDDGRPFLRELIEAGGGDLLTMEAGVVDVLGLDYYAHSQWYFTGHGEGHGTSPHPGRLDDLIVEYHERYQVPVVLGETNIRGNPSDRASWFKYTLEQCESAVCRGVPVLGYCWFPFIDSCDWVSLLRRADRAIDPVGVIWLDDDLQRHESTMSRSFALAAAGLPAAALPAYRFRPPVSDWVAGYLPQMSHWEWIDPPDEIPSTNAPTVGERVEFPVESLEEPPPGAAYEESNPAA